MEHVFSNLIVTNIARKFNINDYSIISICVGSLSGIIISLKNEFNLHYYIVEVQNSLNYLIEFVQLYSTNTLLSILLFVLFSIFGFILHVYYFTNVKSKKKKETQSSLTLLNKKDQRALFKYIKMSPFILDKHLKMQMGFIDNYFVDQSTSSIVDPIYDSVYNEIQKPIQYYDINFNVKIEIIWNFKIQKSEDKNSNDSQTQTKNNQQNVKDAVEKNIYYPIITLLKSNNNNITHAYKYFEEIDKYTLNESKDKILTYNCKILRVSKNILPKSSYTYSHAGDSTFLVKLYQGPFLSIEKKKQMFIDSFFKKQKQRIVDYAHKIEYEKEFFFQQGQNPKMGLILYGPPGSGKSTLIYRLARYLDRNIINVDLSDIYYKKHLLQVIENPYLTQSNTHGNIIVLEEIDVALDKLLKLEELKQQKKKFKKNFEEAKGSNNEILKSLKESKIENTDNSKIAPKNITKKQKYDYNIHDLLAIFDGTAPRSGRIIIATTNHFQRIQNYCPALFRVGRLTPVYIGYLEKDELEELSKYHFKRSILSEVNIDHLFQENGELIITTSKLTEQISNIFIETKNNSEEAFKKFVSFLQNYQHEN